jgi:hypothetical protein
MRVPGEPDARLHGESDDGGVRGIRNVDDLRGAPIELHPELSGDVVGEGMAHRERFRDDRVDERSRVETGREGGGVRGRGRWRGR